MSGYTPWNLDNFLISGEVSSNSSWEDKILTDNIAVELTLRSPQPISGVRINYCGASFIEIECIIESEDDWKIFLPRTLLRAMNDVSLKLNEENRSKVLPIDLFTKSFQKQTIKSLKIKLQQPFTPLCKIGFDNIKIYSSNATLPPSPSKKSNLLNLVTTNETMEKEETTKNISFDIINSLQLLVSFIIVLDIKDEKSKDITNLIKKMGGTVRSMVPSRKQNAKIIILGDLYTNILPKSKYIPIIYSMWIKDCYAKQKLLPSSKYIVKNKSGLSNFDFISSSDEEMDDIIDNSNNKNEDIEDIIIDNRKSDLKCNEILSIPCLLSETNIGFSDDIDEDEIKLLSRYIITYGGKINNNWKNSEITHLLRYKGPPYPSEFKEDITNNPFGGFSILSPQWIFDCHNKQKHIPENAYLWME